VVPSLPSALDPATVVSPIPPAPSSHHIPLLCMPGQQHPSELKSIEKMVNGLDIKPEVVVKSDAIDK